MAADMVLVFFAFNICYYYCRLYLFYTSHVYTHLLGLLIPSFFLTLLLLGAYHSLWKYAEAKEFFICNIASAAAGAIYFILSRLILDFSIPFYFYLVTSAVAGLMLVSVRLLYRVYRDVINDIENKGKKSAKKRTMIVGCGNACHSMLAEIKITPDCNIDPVVGVDDNLNKVGKRFNSLYVAGTTADIKKIADKYKAEQIIIAIPSADNARRAELIERCSEVGVEVKILPRFLDFQAEDRNFIQKIRDITPDELLGRQTVNVVNSEVLDFVRQKTVLVTGGGGSIGSELSRQIAANSPKRLIIVDIYENNAYDIEQELRRAYGDSLDLKVIISSVRDRERISHIIRSYRPDVVIHAAAHKHVPLMETSPAEAVKNNIFGTLNTARAAAEYGVKRFIMISTDKAVNPTNVMGATKRVCEMIIQSMNTTPGLCRDTCFSCVRFGNVLGSNGSVIPLFKKQIADGGPVTVTHPDIIRYFMTIPEAVQLVLVTGAMAHGGEVFVLDMGEPVKIVDLAKKMIAIAGKKIDIEFIGLRPGEKLFEELLMSEEGLQKTRNDKIYVGHPLDFDPDVLRGQLDELWEIVNDNEMSDEELSEIVISKLCDIVPTFKRKKKDSEVLVAAATN